jgi:spermidine synthase
MTPWPTIDKPPGDACESTDATAAQGHSFAKPFVHDDGDSRSLHFTLDELQSRMNKRHPWGLKVDYTRTMMGFLLLVPAPASIAMVGLGGGSLAKFCYRQLPACRITVVEINPHVIALRHDFCVPDDDERFEVLEGDGAAYVASTGRKLDVLLVDGFDHAGQSDALCSQRFYDDCFSALTTEGVLAVNLHYEDARYPVWAERIRRSFGGNAVEIPALEKSNCIVFASRGAPLSPRRIKAQTSLARLSSEARAELKPEFNRILWGMKDLDNG